MWFASVNARFRTPVQATLFAVLLVFISAAIMPLNALAQATSFFLLVVFTLVNLSLIRVKRQGPPEKDGFEAPKIVPWFGAASAAAFAGLSLFELFR